jgi:organic radical activating enzyme
MAAGEKLFCANPFKWFEVSRNTEEGQVFMCCPSWLDTPIGNLLQESVDEVWNGPTAQKIRRSILDGSFRYCNAERCPYLQAVNGPVQRVADVTDPELLDVIRRQLTVLPHGPRQINCSYDRSCNLSCPTCRTKIIVESKSRDRVFQIQEKIQRDALPDAHFLYITGSGDPFGSPFFRRWLQTMRREDLPQVDIIHLHSNGLLWTPEMWETIDPGVRELIREADISIDAATAETYAVNRRGGTFEVLLENLEFISSLRANGPLRSFCINMVVQENNFLEMPAFIELARRFRVDYAYFAQLVNWRTFTEAEFDRRAIHRPQHPRHGELLEVLRDPVFADPIAVMGNLTELHERSLARR